MKRSEYDEIIAKAILRRTRTKSSLIKGNNEKRAMEAKENLEQVKKKVSGKKGAVKGSKVHKVITKKTRKNISRLHSKKR